MLDAVTRAIRTSLDQIAVNANAQGSLTPTVDDNDWTRAIADEICRIGHDRGYEACGTSTYWRRKEKGYQAEWVYDVCWLDYDDDGNYTDLVLALECEWLPKFDEIWDDFCRLVQSRAQLRVMIFEQPTEDDAKVTIDKLLPAIRAFRASQAGDRYLFCGLYGKRPNYNFSYRHYAHSSH